MQVIGPAVAAGSLAVGIFAGWGASMAVFDLALTAAGIQPSMLSQFAEIIGPMIALLFASARW
jgi:hypothetical protein